MGNIYNNGFSGNHVMTWGDILVPTISEDEIGQLNVAHDTDTKERHMYASKLVVSAETSPSYLI